jgi:hypothetical protein
MPPRSAANDVASTSRRAFVALDGIPKTTVSDDNNHNNYAKEITAVVNHLCKIRGVWPTTTSAVLCLQQPDDFSFMDDEVIECLYNGKRGYTLKIYLLSQWSILGDSESAEHGKEGEERWFLRVTCIIIGRRMHTL